MSITRERLKEIGRVKIIESKLSCGESVKCRSMNERERSEYETRFVNAEGDVVAELLAESRRVLIQKCLLEEDGSQMFAESEIDQIAELDGKFAGELDDLLRDLCGLNKEKTVRDARKN